jgi:alcohol dehydrogenase class IV
VETVLAEARTFEPDWIAAVGGGSVVDLAKAVCALVRAPLPVERYHDGEPLSAEVLPLIAVPTTAGTGSEATMVTVLINKRTGVKKSFRHPGMIPRSVILDPELLATCSPTVVAHAGMDALVQAVESYTSKGATWLTDALALKAVGLIAQSLEAVFAAPGNTARAGDLLTGSFLAGCALSNSRLGLVHGLAHPLGARYGAAHGLVCAVCMGPVLRFNRETIGAKHAELTAVLGESPEACFARLGGRLGIRSPFAGKPVVDRARIIEETLASGSTAANPRPVAAGDVERLLDEIFQAGEAI